MNAKPGGGTGAYAAGDLPLAGMADAVRLLSAEMVAQAGSGRADHAAALSDVATVLLAQSLSFDPAKPDWPDRDRLVVSEGHGAPLLYALLYLTSTGDVEAADLGDYRQLGSRTPGSPERGHLPGVEATTGPLGQGLGMAVGMALAERLLNARVGDGLTDHYTYVLAGRRGLMAGLSQEAAELAAELELSRLIVLVEDRHPADDAPSEARLPVDRAARFAAAGWSVRHVDAHDHAAIAVALAEERLTRQPSMIACRTDRGDPLGSGRAADDLARIRQAFGGTGGDFKVPAEIRAAWRSLGRRGAAASLRWGRNLDAASIEARRLFVAGGGLGDEAREALTAIKASFSVDRPHLPTLQSTQRVLDALAPAMPELIGGAVAPVSRTSVRARSQRLVERGSFQGSFVPFGAREHAMAAAMNGIALHGCLVPYGAMRLTFSDYARPAIRLAALMGLRAVFVMTHDSVGVGEDGPTQQPVEQLAALRAMPNLNVYRPADAVEVAEVWLSALQQESTPSVICLSAQSLPTLRRTASTEVMAGRGGYLIAGATADRDVTLLATGSEVAIAVAAGERLAADGIKAAVVSMPCFELFRIQAPEYRRRVLGTRPRVAIEAGVRDPWNALLGERDVFLGLDEFGVSGSPADVYDCFGLTPEAVAAAARRVVA
ncbi:transketolase-like TK C-terminal-containing protein [Methylobrevis albus]|uniref:Transketolase n=1 Tax=Methylobrevis albus TaxID=2793297 RepID=A0A931MXA6_9HYPH|nr:transketolase C-terminal domain-containing protein [Methylobrevis albus]MBH0236767.1 transketolase [Methylobrevis albus]